MVSLFSFQRLLPLSDKLSLTITQSATLASFKGVQTYVAKEN